MRLAAVVLGLLCLLCPLASPVLAEDRQDAAAQRAEQAATRAEAAATRAEAAAARTEAAIDRLTRTLEAAERAEHPHRTKR